MAERLQQVNPFQFNITLPETEFDVFPQVPENPAMAVRIPPPVGAAPYPVGGRIVMGDPQRIKQAQALSATFDIPFAVAYNQHDAIWPAVEKRDPNFMKQVGTDLAIGMGYTYQLGYRALKLAGVSDEIADPYRVEANRLFHSYLPSETAETITWRKLVDPHYMSTTFFRALPMSVGLMGASLVAGYTAAAGAGLAGFGAFGKLVIGTLAGGAFSRYFEASFEGAGTYEKVKSQGGSDAEAEAAANTTFWLNLPLGLLDVAEFAAAFIPFGREGARATKPMLRRIAAATGRYAGVALMEGGEEVIQDFITQRAMHEPITFGPETAVAGAIGATMGLGMAGAGSVYHMAETYISSRMPIKMSQEYDAIIQQNINAGMDEQTASLKAMDELVVKPGGKEFFEKTVSELKDMADGKPVEPIPSEQMDKEIEETANEPAPVPEPEMLSDETIDSIISGETPMVDVLGVEAEPEVAATPDIKPEPKFFISEETYQAALQSAKEKAGGLHAGVDPTIIADWVKIGAYHLERGVRNRVEWTKKMIEQIGEHIRKHLPDIWAQSNDMVKRGLETGAKQKAKVEAIGKPVQPAKAVKPQIRLTTGQQRVVDMVREDVALSAGLKKAEQAARIAYRAGNKDALEAAKAEFKDILIKAKAKAAAKAYAEGFTGAEKLTRQELHSVFKAQQKDALETRKAMVDIIQEHLPPEYQGKFLDAVVNKLSEKKQNELLDRIIAQKERLRKKELTAEVEDLQSYHSSVDVQYQKRINEIIGDINTKNFSEQTIQRLLSLQEYADRHGMPSGVRADSLEKLQRMQARQAKDMTSDELQTLVDIAKHLQEMGKFKRKLKLRYDARKRQQAIERVLKDTVNGDPASDPNSPAGTIARFIQSAYMDSLNSLRVTEMMDGYKGGANTRMGMDLAKADKETQWEARQTIVSAVDDIARIGIDNITEEMEQRITLVMRAREGLTDAVQATMEKLGLDELPALTAQEEQIIEIIRKYATEKYQARIVASYEEMTNREFPLDPNRIMHAYYEGDPKPQTPEQAILPNNYRTAQTSKTFSIKRKKGVKKILRLDLMAMFEQDINEQVWWLGMQPALDNVRQVVKSKEYVQAAGKAYSNWWTDHLDIVARRGWSTKASHNDFTNGLRFYRGNITKAILGYRISSILMQPFAVIDTLVYMQQEYGVAASREVLQEFAKSWVIPGYAKDYVESSIGLKMRAAGEVAVEEALQTVGRKEGFAAKFTRGGLKLLLAADVRTAAGGQSAIENILLARGVPSARAKMEANIIMEMSNSSSDVTFRPHVLGRGEMARTWFTFQSFMLTQWGLIAHNLVMKGLVKGEMKKKLSAMFGLALLAMSQMAQNDIRQFLYNLIKGGGRKAPGNERPAPLEALYGVMSNVPVIGDMFNMVSGRGGQEIPLVKLINDIFRPAVYTKQYGKSLFRAAEAALVLRYGQPGTTQLGDLIEGMLFPKEPKQSGQPHW